MTLSTLSDCGKLEAVAEPMAIAFHPWLVSMMVWPGAGRVPRDHAVWSCQSPLPGLIQAFTCAETEVEADAITDAAKHSARPLRAVRPIEVRIVVKPLTIVGSTLE